MTPRTHQPEYAPRAIMARGLMVALIWVAAPAPLWIMLAMVLVFEGG